MKTAYNLNQLFLISSLFFGCSGDEPAKRSNKSLPEMIFEQNIGGQSEPYAKTWGLSM